MLDFARAVSLILEVLTRRITDQNTLKLISEDIDKIMSGGVPRDEGEIPANYVESHVVPEPIEPKPWTPTVPDLPDGFFELGD